MRQRGTISMWNSRRRGEPSLLLALIPLVVLFAHGSGVLADVGERKPLDRTDWWLDGWIPKGVSRTADGDFRLSWLGEGGKMVTAILAPAWKVSVVVSAAARAGERGLITYSYSVRILPESAQPMANFAVGAEVPLFDSVAPPGWRSLRPSFRTEVSGWSDAGEVVGAPKGSLLEFAFSASTVAEAMEVSRILGGTGFVHTAASLPGVVRCWARGQTEIMRVPEEVPQELQDWRPRPLEDSVSGWTIGPVAVPYGQTAAAHLSRTREYLEKATKEGWVVPELAAKLEALVDELAAAMASKDTNAVARAAWHLTEAVRKGEGSGTVFPEGFALIDFNIRHVEALFRDEARRHFRRGPE